MASAQILAHRPLSQNPCWAHLSSRPYATARGPSARYPRPWSSIHAPQSLRWTCRAEEQQSSNGAVGPTEQPKERPRDATVHRDNPSFSTGGPRFERCTNAPPLI